jgi:hypothetical protein
MAENAGLTGWRLYVDNKFTGVTVKPDNKWPSMYRIHMAGQAPSDMMNLSRAKDAATVWWRPRGLSGGQVARWHRRERPKEAGRSD